VSPRVRLALRSAAFLGVAAFMLWLPFTLSATDITLYTQMGLYAMVAIGLSLLMGFAGQVSFGQGAFYCLGAYVAGILATKHAWPTLGALALAPVVTGAAAAVVGVPLLRLRGHYLAFATLALHLILLAVVFAQNGLTGGEIGLAGIPHLQVAGHEVSVASFAAVAWGLALIVGLVSARLVSSRAGRGLQAIAASESFAAAAGVNVSAYKLQLFVLSAGYAGLAGGLYAYLLQYLSPDSFPLMISVEVVVMAAVGGIGSVWGAVLGSIAIVELQNQLQNLGTNATLVHHFPSIALQLPKVVSIGVYGLILAGTMLFLPRGILPSVLDRIRPSAHRQTAVDVEGGAGDVAGVG
jgi:branched-chain amino acid transport system permease protein